MDREDQIDLRLLESDIEMNILSLEKTKDWQKNPNLYVETLLMSIFLLTSRDSVSKEQKRRSIISRLGQFGRALREARRNLKNPPRIFTEVALETLSGAKIFFGSLENQWGLTSRAARGKTPLKRAIEKAQRELRSFEIYLKEDLLPRSRGNFALGKRLFEARLKKEHFLEWSADRLYRFGQREMARVEGELRTLAKKINRRKSWQDLVEELKDQTPEAENLLGVYRQEVASLINFLKEKNLVTFPIGEKCVVMETPDFERPTVPYAAYMPPAPFEKNHVGHFWVTTITQSSKLKAQNEQLREHCRAAMILTTLHESYPGHHLQFSRANRVASVVRKHGGSSLLCEGWALYCEQMMGEVGYYKDVETKLFMLKDELWRAARVVIDVGLHCRGWSVVRAVELLVKRAKLAPSQALAEVKRYTLSPTQPMSYLVGKKLILEMRARAKKEWGRGFSLKKFHDKFLAAGTIPTPLIEEEFFGKEDPRPSVKEICGISTILE